MNIGYFFFLLVSITVVITRLFLAIYPIPAPTIKRFRVHHYMYGAGLILIGLSVHWIVAYAIGIGLFLDELTYLFLRGTTHKDNYSAPSLLGTLFFVALVFAVRTFLVKPWS